MLAPRGDRDRERDLFRPPWHRKPDELGAGGPPLHAVDDLPLLEFELNDYTFPLFLQSSSTDLGLADAMDHSPSPSPSPSPVPFAAIGGRTASPAPSKTSNLTSALQGAARADTHTTPGAAGMGPSMNGSSGDAGTKRHDSFGGGGMSASTGQNGGARPISMKNANRERPRRESVAGSMVGAMSWGGISVGSWIRDEYVFAHASGLYLSSLTPPFPWRSNLVGGISDVGPAGTVRSRMLIMLLASS